MNKKVELNKGQLEALNHVEGPLLVLAGAGSGKTQVVISRIAHLIHLGIPPSDILAVTFTNKAANELKQRIEKLNLLSPLTVTFHALGLRILRESIHHFGYRNDFSVMDASDTESLLKQIIFTITNQNDKGVVKRMATLISFAKSKLFLPDSGSLSELHFESNAEKALFLEVYKTYNQRLKIANAVDFDDLILLTVYILQDSELRQKYANRWKFILVDEYQDTNHAQYLICKALCSIHKNLFVVGDPDQSIYSWRGAKIRNILNFENDFPGTKVVLLEQNYRSTGHILSAANRVIEKNDRLYEKKLFSENGDGEKVGVHQFANGFEEVKFVISQIKNYKKQNIDYSEMVIFYRTNSQSRMFEDGCIEYGVPYKIIGGISFYQRKEIKDILAYLRFLSSPSDPISFSRIINLPKRGIGQKTIENIVEESIKTNSSIVNCMKALLLGEGSFKLTKKAKEGIFSFLNLYDFFKSLLDQGISLADLITEVFSKSGYGDFLKEEKDTFHDRLENIDELISKADSYDKGKDSSLIKFLEDVCLDVDNIKEQESLSKVSLMTIHNAKGLEFDVCFLVGLEEDVFPHIRCRDSIEGLEEERRLFYVGITRAKRILHISAAFRRFLWGSEKIMRPSRFLSELPKEHILGQSELSLKELTKDLSVGKQVYHKTFGKGTINKVYETSYGETLDILFERDNEKRTLVAKYAKLSALE
jgi:DNA helicase-2/ATP-dependent DNA helicase PcrA